MASWSMLGGVVGGLLGVLGSVRGAWGVGTIVVLAALGWGISFIVPFVLATLTERAARTLSTPSGRSTPRKQGHSLAESLVARGLYEDGIAAFEEAIAANPRDPAAYLRLSRVYRDKLARYDEAERWLKRALDESSAPLETATLLKRELVALYVTKMKRPERAAPLLARMAEELDGSPAGTWAANELLEVKATIGRGPGTG